MSYNYPHHLKSNIPPHPNITTYPSSFYFGSSSEVITQSYEFMSYSLPYYLRRKLHKRILRKDSLR